MRDAADTLHGRNDEIGPNNDKQSTADQEETKSDQLEHLLKKIKQNELELKSMKQLKEELKRMKQMGPYRVVGSIVLFILCVYAATHGLNELRENRLKINEQRDELRAMNELLNSVQGMVDNKLKFKLSKSNKFVEIEQLNALQEKLVKMEEYQKQQQRNIVDLQKTIAALNDTINDIGMYVENDEIEPDNEMGLKEELKDMKVSVAMKDVKQYKEELKDQESWLKACGEGHLDTVKALIVNGEDIEATFSDGLTGLMVASAFGKANVVRFLLSKGARIDRTSDNGFSALYLAASQGHFELCRELVAKGADVNQESDGGFSPWLKACENGHLDIVKLFVANGQDIKATARNGATGLIAASVGGKANVVRFLLSKGARTDRTDGKGIMALRLAVENGHGEIVEILTRYASASAN